MSSIRYNANHYLPARIVDHFKLALTSDLGDRGITQKNLLEKAGDGILLTVNLVPRAVKAIAKSFQDPRVITLALTALALFGTSLAFYPATTSLMASKACTFIATTIAANIPFWSVKFAAYITTCAWIIGLGARAEGRFCNTALMDQFYRNTSNVHA